MTTSAPIDPTTGQVFTPEQIAAFQSAASAQVFAGPSTEQVVTATNVSTDPIRPGDLQPLNMPTELDKALAAAVQGVDCAAAAAQGVAEVSQYSSLEELAGAFVLLQKTVHALEDHHAQLDEAVSAVQATVSLVPKEFWAEVATFWDKIVNMFGVHR